jgi:hypothetical protein
MKGIWLFDSDITKRKELYISATYMSTGILRSENFNGEITEDGLDLTGHTKYKVTSGTKGMYINMNTGYIWAKTFDLNTDSIYLGDTGKTFTIDKTSRSDVVLRMGSSFAVTSTGVLYASNANITGAITGGTIDGAGITGGSLSIGKLDSGGYNFTVTEAGVMTAQSATIKGNITASSGKIGGWNIVGDNLQCGSITLDGSTGTISGSSAGKSFSVAGGTGYMTATGATLTTLTVTNSLTVNASGSSGGGSGGSGGGGGGGSSGNTQVEIMSLNSPMSRAAAAGGADGAGSGGAASVGSLTSALCTINGTTKITGQTELGGSTRIGGNTEITGSLRIGSTTSITGNVDLTGRLSVNGATTCTDEATEIEIDAPY